MDYESKIQAINDLGDNLSIISERLDSDSYLMQGDSHEICCRFLNDWAEVRARIEICLESVEGSIDPEHISDKMIKYIKGEILKQRSSQAMEENIR